MGAFLIVFLSRHNTVLRSGVMAFSEVWQGGSGCCIVLIADWGGGGNVISDWSVARVGWKFDVYRPLGISQCVCVCVCVGDFLCVWREEERKRWHCSCVNFAALQYIEQEWLCVLCVMFLCSSVYVGPRKCAFCFTRHFMSFLDCFTPWG